MMFLSSCRKRTEVLLYYMDFLLIFPKIPYRNECFLTAPKGSFPSLVFFF